MATTMQRGLFDEQAARDDALARVNANAGPEFYDRVCAVVRYFGQPFTGEDLRLACEEVGIRPHHANAWGALVNTLVRRGVIVGTGVYVAMRAQGSHARKTQLYRLNLEIEEARPCTA